MTTDSPILPRFLYAPYATERRVPLYPPPGFHTHDRPDFRPQTVVAIYKPVWGVMVFGLSKFEYQGVVVLP